MGRSEARRRAVRIAASLVDLKDCLRAEMMATVERRHRPPLQATGARARYVTLRPPRPRPLEAGDGAGGASGEGAATAAGEEELDTDAFVAPRTREARIGPEFQATRLPPYEPTGARCGGALRRRGAARAALQRAPRERKANADATAAARAATAARCWPARRTPRKTTRLGR
jgi:hypothetical protein